MNKSSFSSATLLFPLLFLIGISPLYSEEFSHWSLLKSNTGFDISFFNQCDSEIIFPSSIYGDIFHIEEISLEEDLKLIATPEIQVGFIVSKTAVTIPARSTLALHFEQNQFKADVRNPKLIYLFFKTLFEGREAYKYLGPILRTPKALGIFEYSVLSRPMKSREIAILRISFENYLRKQKPILKGNIN